MKMIITNRNAKNKECYICGSKVILETITSSGEVNGVTCYTCKTDLSNLYLRKKEVKQDKSKCKIVHEED